MAVEKTIRYNGGQFNMRASAAVLIAYKEQFGTEYTEDFTAAGKSPLKGRNPPYMGYGEMCGQEHCRP